MWTTEPITSTRQDVFGVHKLIKRFVLRVLKKDNNPSLIGIFARWGTGKTSALNLCPIIELSLTKNERDVLKKAHWVAPFQAWQMENAGNLQLALLWHLVKCFDSHFSVNSKKSEGIKNSIKRIGVALSIISLNMAGKIIGIGNIAQEAIAGLKNAEDISKNDDFETYIKKKFQSCEKIKETEEALNQLSAELCKLTKSDLIVIRIDDIDRCRPDIAIDFFFSLKNLLLAKQFCFIVALDKDAITKYLRLRYGKFLTQQDASWFLEKFFDDWVSLPRPNLYKLLDNFKISNKEIGSLAKEVNLFDIADNVRSFIRGCQKFEFFVHNKFKKRLPDKYILTLYLGWFLLYTNSPEQLEAVLLSKGMDDENDNFKFSLTICLIKLGIKTINNIMEKENPNEEETKIKKIMEKKNDNNENHLIAILPFQLQEILEIPNSALVKFLKKISKSVLVNQLNETLLEIIPYL